MFLLAQAVLFAVALLQAADPNALSALGLPSQPVPYQPSTETPYAGPASLSAGLQAARSRNVASARAIAAQLTDPVARKLVEWAVLDVSGNGMDYADIGSAQADFAQWPRANARQEAGERALYRARLSPRETLAWFGDAKPVTAEGAMSLASALQASGRDGEARTLARTWWRDRSFDQDTQSQFLARFGAWLDQGDHIARLDMLLLGQQGPATRAMLTLVPAEWQQLALARIAIRNGAMDAEVPASLADDRGLAFERARRYRAAGNESLGFLQLARLPAAPASLEGQNLLWAERRNYFLDALEVRNWQAAYDAMNGHGFPSGDRKVDAEFFAGWVALTKLNDPARAAVHFQALRDMSTTPITQSRALYWLGRAADARGDRAAAQSFWTAGSQYVGAFYGQLSAERAGVRDLVLPPEPQPTAADRARFNRDEVVRAARLLGEAGERSLFRVFLMSIDDRLTSAADYALLVDLAREYGDQDLSMHVARSAAQRGFLLSERAYPLRTIPEVPNRPDPAFILAITRQESAFDPRARSGANARGMMQLIPPTARTVARQLGVGYSDEMLWDPDYNMRLGSYHLGDMLGIQGGSYLLTTVAYNAGPSRATQWVPRCGDPRGAQVDPVDFIECAPFTETRNYMMRVMENMQVYRARLNGGSAPYTLSREIARGDNGPRPYTTLGPSADEPQPTPSDDQ